MADLHQERSTLLSSPMYQPPSESPHSLPDYPPDALHAQSSTPMLRSSVQDHDAGALLPSQPPRSSSPPRTMRPAKRLAPGLEQRLKRLEQQKETREADSGPTQSIGRIPEKQLRELERLQREQAVNEVRRRGKAWSGPSGGVRLAGGPVLTDNELSVLESDVSSVIDISDHFVASETEDEPDDRQLHDTNKYRLPDIGKTRLHLLTKEPLSPGPEPAAPPSPGRSERSASNPTTPQTSHSPTEAPIATEKIQLPHNWHSRNMSVDSVTDGDLVGRRSASRAGSIYTLGRASFTGQLAQLTSMRLPDAESLAKRISDMPTASEAAKALVDASEQIRVWISKASDVLDGLNAEDDIEWAAAGGSEGIDDVDKAINRFERLVKVYVESIELLQVRDDAGALSPEEIKGSVGRMESIACSWKMMKDNLKGVKDQVEIAIEWESLWNSALGEVAQEMDGLNRLVFEMEEKRHQGAESLLSSKDSIDLSELETIVEEPLGRGSMPNSSPLNIQSFSLNTAISAPHVDAPLDKEDSSLLALFARMQPLRASLDFLPMRLAAWKIRGKLIFPSACIDLEQQQEHLESQWEKLKADAESLRRELGEDRWVMVFRNAGRQALKMCESITRSFLKLKDSTDANEQATSPASMVTRIENYEQKKRHYGPAIERVLAIIDRGVLDRLTVNGEVLRLQSDMKRRWTALQQEMSQIDSAIEEIGNEMRERNLHESLSTVMSSERSIASSLMETPGSSPASSVIGGSRKGSFGSVTPTPLTVIKTRSSSSSAPKSRLPSASSIPRKLGLPKPSHGDRLSISRSSPVVASTSSTSSTQIAWPSRPDADQGQKPRFVQQAKAQSRDFRPLSAFEPSPYAKAPITPKADFLRRNSIKPEGTLTGQRTSRIVSAPLPQHSSSLPRPTNPRSTPMAQASTPSRPRPLLHSKLSAPSLLRPSSRAANGGRGASTLPVSDGNEADNESPSHHRQHSSALASGRRSSMLPIHARSRLDDMSLVDGGGDNFRPKWRP